MLAEAVVAARDTRSAPLAAAQENSAGAARSSVSAGVEAVRKGREFLVGLLDPELDLLPEFRGARVYWLFHDNYLATKVLSASHPEVARRLRAALEREGVRESGKVELLFGEARSPLPFRHYQLREVRRAGGKTIRTEVVTDRVMAGWEQYADLLLMASIAEQSGAARTRRYGRIGAGVHRTDLRPNFGNARRDVGRI